MYKKRVVVKLDHCSFNKEVRLLFNKKQFINNSDKYTKEEKELLINKIDANINRILELI